MSRCVRQFLLPIVLMSSGFAGCGASSSEPEDTLAASSLTVETGVASLDECPNGGVELDHGIDSNGNGSLDADEVSETYALCNGVDGNNAPSSHDDLSDLPDLTVFSLEADLATVATTGNYTDLLSPPDLSVYATAASLAPVATSGSYTDLTELPWVSGSSGTGIDGSVAINTTNPTGMLTVHSDVFDAPAALDQSSTEDGALYDEATSFWQSFTAGATGRLTHLTVNPWWTNPENGYTLNIYVGDGVDGPQIYSESGIDIDPGSGPETHTIVLANVAAIKSSVQYTWELTNATNFQLVGYPWASYEGGHADQVIGASDDYYFETQVQPTTGTQTALEVSNDGRVGIGTKPTAALDVNGSVRLRDSRSPLSDDPCNTGEVTWDADYVYVCVATDSWRRSGLATY